VEAKIQALIELAANGRDPDFLSTRWTRQPRAMDHTEATLISAAADHWRNEQNGTRYPPFWMIPGKAPTRTPVPDTPSLLPGGLPPWAPPWPRSRRAVLLGHDIGVPVAHGNPTTCLPIGVCRRRRTGYGTIRRPAGRAAWFGKLDCCLHGTTIWARAQWAFAWEKREAAPKMIVAIRTHKIRRPEHRQKNESRRSCWRCSRPLRPHNIPGRPTGQSVRDVIIASGVVSLPVGRAGSTTSFPAAAMLVTLLNWAKEPAPSRNAMASCWMDERRADLSERVTSSPHVASIELPLPSVDERERFIKAAMVGGNARPGGVLRLRRPTLAR